MGYVINTETGKRYNVEIVEKTKQFAKVRVPGHRPMGFSRRTDGRWFETGATRKDEKTVEFHP